MDRTTTVDNVQEIIEKVTDIPKEEIEVDAKLIDDLDISSFEVITIVAEIESKFKINIPEKELRRMASVEDIVNYICGE